MVCSTSSTHLTNAKRVAGRGDGCPGKPTRVRRLQSMKIAPPVMAGQSRDVKSETAGERPVRQLRRDRVGD